MENNKKLAISLARFVLGVNIWAHGVVRLPNLKGFSDWMTTQYKDTILPAAMVHAWSYAIPVVEFILGGLLVIGLFSRNALVAMAIYLAILIFGSCLIQQWEWAAFQMVYMLFVYLLLFHLEYNTIAIDSLIGHKKNN